MTTRWPTDILLIGKPPRSIWGRIYGHSIDANPVDALGDELIGKNIANTVTATADIRSGTAAVGETLTDPDGQVWTIMRVSRAESRYAGGLILSLEQGVEVEGRD